MTDDQTMTDTTKPTGDTIDDAIMELANIMCGEPEICEEHWEAAESAIKAGYRRLAERPNRAVARGDSVTISREAISVMLLAAKWAEGKIGVRENPLILAIMNLEAAVQNALTTPTETTDPAMEGDDAE